MPLVNLWRDSKETVLEMGIQAIVATAGDGSLKDKSEASEELRIFLSEIESRYLKKYANQCLTNPFPDSGFVFQDIVNEAGRRLGLTVENGIYRGKQDKNNCDGIWKTGDWIFVVEVKTTDAYSIQLGKIADYLASEVGDKNEDSASCLIIVGRQDTSTLEDQLRGSRYNWRMRIVGIEALFSAIELREITEDKSLVTKITDLFKPREFTRVDEIISTAFDFATDQEEAGYKPTEISEGDEASSSANTEKTKTAPNLDLIEEFKQDVLNKMSKKFGVDFDRNRSLFYSDKVRFCVTVSKGYNETNKYWYAYHTRQKDFLNETDDSFFVVGCLDVQKAFAIPKKRIDEIATGMTTSIPNGDESKKYHHVYVREESGRYFIYAPLTKQELDINEFEI